jgi:hypothetical protein
LIVEDEPFIALALEAMLFGLGYNVAGSAGQVSAALELVGRERIDGAILDVNLGSERVDPVADILAARACPFFFTTGFSDGGWHFGPPRPACGMRRAAKAVWVGATFYGLARGVRFPE